MPNVSAQLRSLSFVKNIPQHPVIKQILLYSVTKTRWSRLARVRFSETNRKHHRYFCLILAGQTAPLFDRDRGTLTVDSPKVFWPFRPLAGKARHPAH
jgi:hypothetical protein